MSTKELSIARFPSKIEMISYFKDHPVWNYGTRSNIDERIIEAIAEYFQGTRFNYLGLDIGIQAALQKSGIRISVEPFTRDKLSEVLMEVWKEKKPADAHL